MTRLLILALLLCCSACSSMGPQTIPNDQFNYNNAIANASREQMLSNLVRIRYAETPTFLRVSSVISQYTRGASASVGVGANTSASGDDTASASGRARWSDRPVITYTPITGQQFVQDLLTAPNPGRLLELMQAGWPVDLVIRTSILSVNGVDNSVTLPSRPSDADAEFFELFRLWAVLGANDLLQLRRAPSDEGTRLLLYVDPGPHPELDADLRQFREILELDPEISEFEIVFGKAPRPDEIAILTASLWDTMTNMAWQLPVPPEHITSGRTGRTFTSAHPNYETPIDVRFSKDKPDDAYATVYAQNYWFYIDQNDLKSKRVFTFLELMMNMTEGNVAAQAPLMTISN